MSRRFRKLNETGLSQFRDYVRGGAVEDAPVRLLHDPATSSPLENGIDELGSGLFENRYMFGLYLGTLLRKLNPAQISSDSGLWSGLALFWFDRLCPRRADGSREMREEYHYILSSDYRHYYRHLVRSPWQLVRDHGQASRFLLISPQQQPHPLSVHGEILEQFGGRQQVLRSRPIIRAASRLYFDEEAERPRRGVAGNGRGSARRFALVLRQFDLTFDAENMSENAFVKMLPDEFERWRRLMREAK